MRRLGSVILVMSAFSLSSCEKKFDEKFDENLKELTSEAEAIKAQADERLAAGKEADKAIEGSPMQAEEKAQ